MIDAPAAPAPPLQALPDTARAWVYVTAEPMSETAAAAVEAGLRAFFRDWRSHGRIVQGAAAVVDAQIVVVAATLEAGEISGCGIDQHVRVLDALLEQVGARHAESLALAYRTPTGAVRVVSRPAFRAAEAAGDVAGRIPREALTLGAVRASGAVSGV